MANQSSPPLDFRLNLLPPSDVVGPSQKLRRDASTSAHLDPSDVHHPFHAPHHAFQPFSKVLGPSPYLRLLASTETDLGGSGEALFHEAGVFVAPRARSVPPEVWITSNILSDGGGVRIDVSKLALAKERPNETLSRHEGVLVAPGIEIRRQDVGVTMANGGTAFKGEILFCAQGQDVLSPAGTDDQPVPSSLMLVDPYTQGAKAREILNNFHGRVFNSLNDVAVHASSGYVFFTDPDYGHEQGFKLRPQLPNAVWRFHPARGSVQMVADGLAKPNGIVFSPDEKTCFVTDTDFIRGDGDRDGRRAGTIYAFDVVTKAGVPSLHNRRVFAFVDCGAPDGIKCDADGNVYTGCFDGVHVFGTTGELIGKIVLPPDAQGRQRGCANLVFAEKGSLIILAERTVWEAGIAAIGDPKKDVR